MTPDYDAPAPFLPERTFSELEQQMLMELWYQQNAPVLYTVRGHRFSEAHHARKYAGWEE